MSQQDAILSGGGIADIDAPLMPMTSDGNWLLVWLVLLVFVLIVVAIIAAQRSRHSATGKVSRLMQQLHSAGSLEPLASEFYRAVRDTEQYAGISNRLEQLLFSGIPYSRNELANLMADYISQCKERRHG